MEVSTIIEIVSTLGFPIVCVIGMAWFIYRIYSNMTQQSQTNMEKVQARCAEREDKLYEEIKENREVNAQAIATIGLYADRLNHIEDNLEDVKCDVSYIKDRLNN